MCLRFVISESLFHRSQGNVSNFAHAILDQIIPSYFYEHREKKGVSLASLIRARFGDQVPLPLIALVSVAVGINLSRRVALLTFILRSRTVSKNGEMVS
jgi:hypothetical protein